MSLHTYQFIKESSGWYIDLPAYIQQGGSKADLQMIDGADTMLDIAAAGNSFVTLQMDTSDFEGADKLELTEVCDPLIGGGYYLLRNWEGAPVMHSMWLCSVTTFVFNGLPEEIFVKRALPE